MMEDAADTGTQDEVALASPSKLAPAAAVQASLDDDEPAEQLYKVLVIGDYGVGKTSVRGSRRAM